MEFVGISMIRNKLHILFFCTFILFGCKPTPAKKEAVKVKQQPPVLQKIIESKEIKVVIINNSVDYFIYKGTPMGFHYELAKEYAKHLGVGLSLHVAPDYTSAFQMLETEQCSILASNVNITGSRKKKMLFATPLLRSNPVLIQNKNSSIQYVEDWLDVDSLKIGIPAQSANERIIRNIEEDLGLCIQTSLYSDMNQEQLIDRVAQDSIAATLADKIVAKVAQTYYPQLDISINAGLPHNMSWALNLRATELLQHVNNWLNHYKKTKAYRRLYTKYFRNKKSILRNKEGHTTSNKQLSAYDKYIKKEAKILGWDWRLLAALIYTESRFDASQVSWAGAFGLMQLMPVTARSFGVSHNSPAKKQIVAGRKYIQYLEEEFAKNMTDRKDLKLFVLAAYNCGSGHIADAQKLAEKYGKDKDNWNDVKPYILLLSSPEYYNHKVVKHGYFRGRETVNHVSRIMNLYKSYKNLLSQK